MSRSRRKRQCHRKGCTCCPRGGARRRRYALANDFRDQRTVGSAKDVLYEEMAPPHVMPRSSKDRNRAVRTYDAIGDANRNHRG